MAHSEITESPSELKFTAPKEYAGWLRDAAVQRAVQQLAGRAMKITVIAGEGAAAASAPAAPQTRDETSQRVLADPALQPFLQMKGSEVRSVRDLKE